MFVRGCTSLHKCALPTNLKKQSLQLRIPMSAAFLNLALISCPLPASRNIPPYNRKGEVEEKKIKLTPKEINRFE